MTQIWAIFFDAYRNLNSKKLFWITLILSGLVVLAFAFIGINEKGLTVLAWELPNPYMNTDFMSPDYFYKTMFANVGINLWLAWIGTIMALVSTAGIFPDLMSKGSIDLAVSKPISRFRLFMTQYVAGLLFVGLQVTIFTVASFFIIGFRGGVWEPGLFIAVPLVLCLFSYLFSVSVLIGVKTRSTVAAILLTLMFWAALSILNSANMVITMELSSPAYKGGYDPYEDVEFGAIDEVPVPEELIVPTEVEDEINPDEAPASEEASAEETEASESPIEETELETAIATEIEDPSPFASEEISRRTGQTREPPEGLIIADKIIGSVAAVMPKTNGTIYLLERSLIDMAELPDETEFERNSQQRGMVETMRERSPLFVLGSSLAFEFLILMLAARIFCRRDY